MKRSPLSVIKERTLLGPCMCICKYHWCVPCYPAASNAAIYTLVHHYNTDTNKQCLLYSTNPTSRSSLAQHYLTGYLSLPPPSVVLVRVRITGHRFYLLYQWQLLWHTQHFLKKQRSIYTCRPVATLFYFLLLKKKKT